MGVLSLTTPQKADKQRVFCNDHLYGKDEVSGSNPDSGSNNLLGIAPCGFFSKNFERFQGMPATRFKPDNCLYIPFEGLFAYLLVVAI